MMFGPDKNGNFKPVFINEIHENRVPIDHADISQSISLNIDSKEPIKRNHVRKGINLINPIKSGKN